MKIIQSNTNKGGTDFAGLLTIVFIVLKLLKVIEWSWFWVLSPLIFVTAVILLIFIVMIIIAWIGGINR